MFWNGWACMTRMPYTCSTNMALFAGLSQQLLQAEVNRGLCTVAACRHRMPVALMTCCNLQLQRRAAALQHSVVELLQECADGAN